MVMFVFAVFRNITLWPCFPERLAKYGRWYRTFVHYFVDYFLNFVVFCIIVAFSVVVWR